MYDFGFKDSPCLTLFAEEKPRKQLMVQSRVTEKFVAKGANRMRNGVSLREEEEGVENYLNMNGLDKVKNDRSTIEF
ncbi:unnamed protein product [Dracunculus medinensis]|uniref:Gag-pol polyprotein n=1 Tax=Dracunculus medinensis TaxID=318479 RepID=A0A0N4U0P7_DRAME|nr:unnamed protein product [Dracunculus medinensis]